MDPVTSSRLADTLGPPRPAARATPAPAPLAPLPALMEWITAPPAPLPRQDAAVEGGAPAVEPAPTPLPSA